MSDDQTNSERNAVPWADLNWETYLKAQQMLLWMPVKADGKSLYVVVLLAEFRKALQQFIKDFDREAAHSTHEGHESCLQNLVITNDDDDDDEFGGIIINFNRVRVTPEEDT